MLLFQLILFTLAAFWGFSYYIRTTTEAPTTEPKEMPEMVPESPQMDRRQLERIAANCLWSMMTPSERQEASIYMKCRDASDSELTAIIERYKTEY